MIKKTRKKFKSTDFDDYLKEELKDPEFRRCYHEYGIRLQIAYPLLQMRKNKKMSQKELAMRLDSTQAVVVRMENSEQNFSLKMLGKIADVFGKELKISFE